MASRCSSKFNLVKLGEWGTTSRFSSSAVAGSPIRSPSGMNSMTTSLHRESAAGVVSSLLSPKRSQDRLRAMSIQFAGSKSSDDRRRRRLLVNTDDQTADEATGEEGLYGAGVTSELVASSAAAPWVPVYEWRIWTYAALILLALSGAAFALSMPMAFRPELAPLTKHLLQGDRPILAVLIQTTFCFLAAQLAVLIGWYRAQCKLDFRGYYRVWPWVAVVLGVTALCSATDIHGQFGLIIERSGLVEWRPRVISWLLPASLIALPIVVLLDRDVRRSRSSLYMLRLTWLLAIASAWLELGANDLTGYPWIAPTRIILPMFTMASLFVGLWFHARTVAYVCPDPPEAEVATAKTQILSVWNWLASWFTRKPIEVPVDEAEAKPKRGRKKAAEATEDEEEAPKRKRRAPAKRAAKPRTRAKAVETEEEEVQEEEQETGYDEAADVNEGYETESAAEESESESNNWEEEETEPEPAPPPAQSNRYNRESTPAPQSAAARKPANSGWEEAEQSSEGSDEDEDSDDAILRRDSGMTAEQMQGLTKRQKRDLRKQQRSQRR